MNLNLYSRLVVGWSMEKRMKAKLVCDALRMALWRQRMPKGVVVQWYRGSQYACGDYQEALRVHGMRFSMNRSGDGRDNAFMESIFHTLETEPIHRRDHQIRWEAKADVFEYIEVFCNQGRRHSVLGCATPVEDEMVSSAASPRVHQSGGRSRAPSFSFKDR